MSYCSYYGKKIDPEPGRCRRTDGKKWRCSRDAHPDSKYCERHMIRRRYRSRKPVESQAAAPPSSSNVGSDVVTGSRSGSGSLPLHTNGSREGLNLVNNLSQLQMESLRSEISKKEYRYIHLTSIHYLIELLVSCDNRRDFYFILFYFIFIIKL